VSTARRFQEALTFGLFRIACAALVIMLSAYVAEVVLRYLFNAPTRWSSDVVSYAMLVTISFALPSVTRDGGHVAITSLIERLSTQRQQMAFRLLAWVSALVCAAATTLLIAQALAQWQGGIETVATLAIPKWCLSVAVALGMAGAAGQFVGHALKSQAVALGGERDL
jgi:TRAP-type C4-dicarboxylate transport system permease small subunit